MDKSMMREDLRQIVEEFLAAYAAASELSWKNHMARNGSGYLLPSKGRFFTAEERDAFDREAGQYRSRAETILGEAERKIRSRYLCSSRRKSGLDELCLAVSLMNAAEAENGRWSGNYPAYVDRLLEACFPGCGSRSPGRRQTSKGCVPCGNRNGQPCTGGKEE